MKYLSRYLIFGFVLILGFTTSCNDELNQSPLDAPANTNFFSNKDELTMAINGAYTGLWWGGDPMPIYLDNITDLGFLRSGYNGMKSVGQGAATSETGEFQSTWDHMYSSISKCNNLLENMSRAKDNVSDDFFTRIQAEARFLRAFYYFWLTELYGDVPLLTKVPKADEAKVARTPQNEVVNQIIKDLDFAAQNLPNSWSGSDVGRATKGAALTLKARTALLNGRYDVAATAAKSVMDMGIYSLYPNYEELFQYPGVRSSEVILDAPYQKGVRTTGLPIKEGTRNVGAWSTIVPSQFMVDTYEATDGKQIDESSLYDPQHPFENRDPRLDASIIRPGSIFAGYVFYTHPDSTMTWYVQDGQKKRVTNQDVTNPYATYTGYCWRKYNSPQDFPQNIQSSELNFIYMRYAEDLLTYAEAKIEQGNIDQSVLDAINKVRARAYGVDPSQTNQYPAVTTMNQDQLRKEVRYERTVEFANEGLRLFDIRRWKIGKDVMDGTLVGRPKGAYTTVPNTPDIDENGHPHYDGMMDLFRSVEQRSFDPKRDYLWAIPQKELDVNDKMSQNPGY